MRGSPFTRLCRQAAHLARPVRADLHTHTTHSDGLRSPTELAQAASKLDAVAVTDHDTTAGVLPTRAASRVDVIAGVEITATFRDAEIHLLGYFIDLEHEPLQSALSDLRHGRRERLRSMAERLRPLGVDLVDRVEAMPAESSLGRRHLARWLMEGGQARSLHAAFTRWINRPELAGIPKRRLPAAEALRLIGDAGGVSSWAHPPESTDADALRELQALGLRGVECAYPWAKPSHGTRLRGMATSLGLLVTGGSDSHDDSRTVGLRGVSADELAALRSSRNAEVGMRK